MKKMESSNAAVTCVVVGNTNLKGITDMTYIQRCPYLWISNHDEGYIQCDQYLNSAVPHTTNHTYHRPNGGLAWISVGAFNPPKNRKINGQPLDPPEDNIQNHLRSLSNDLSTKTDEFLRNALNKSGLSIEEFANTYVLEEGPIELVTPISDDDVYFKQTLQLKKRTHRGDNEPYNDTPL